jgi:peroxiredoxin
VDLVDGQRETKETGAQYIEEQGFSFPVYFDVEQEAASAYGILSIPTTLFIDKDGYIVTGVQGAIDAKTLRKGIDLIK